MIFQMFQGGFRQFKVINFRNSSSQKKFDFERFDSRIVEFHVKVVGKKIGGNLF